MHARGRPLAGIPQKDGSVSARVSCRARSARKLKKTAASPSRIRTGPSDPAMIVGGMNSSLSPRAYAAAIASPALPAASPRPPHERLVSARHAVPALVAIHRVVAPADRRDASARCGEGLLEALDVVGGGAGRRVPAVGEDVHRDPRHAAPPRELEQGLEVALVGVDAAVGDEAEEMQRGAGRLLRVLGRADAGPGSRRRIRRGSTGPRGGGPAAPCARRRDSGDRPRSCPSVPPGSPTASPEASSSVHGRSASQRSKVGLRASEIAFPAEGGAWPQPSQIRRRTGGLAVKPAIRSADARRGLASRSGARDPRRRGGRPCTPRKASRRAEWPARRRRGEGPWRRSGRCPSGAGSPRRPAGLPRRVAPLRRVARAARASRCSSFGAGREEGAGGSVPPAGMASDGVTKRTSEEAEAASIQRPSSSKSRPRGSAPGSRGSRGEGGCHPGPAKARRRDRPADRDCPQRCRAARGIPRLRAPPTARSDRRPPRRRTRAASVRDAAPGARDARGSGSRAPPPRRTRGDSMRRLGERLGTARVDEPPQRGNPRGRPERELVEQGTREREAEGETRMTVERGREERRRRLEAPGVEAGHPAAHRLAVEVLVIPADVEIVVAPQAPGRMGREDEGDAGHGGGGASGRRVSLGIDGHHALGRSPPREPLDLPAAAPRERRAQRGEEDDREDLARQVLDVAEVDARGRCARLPRRRRRGTR